MPGGQDVCLKACVCLVARICAWWPRCMFEGLCMSYGHNMYLVAIVGHTEVKFVTSVKFVVID